jgi:ssDNA-binding Zn-finger/Zn-ribbon topoisomerase 1
LKVKTSQAGSLFIACTGFPNCKTTFSLPKGLENVEMVDEKCKNCEKKGLSVKKLRLDFATEYVNQTMSDVLTEDDGTSGVFCVWPGCD